MADYFKEIQTELIPISAVAAGAQLLSSVFDVSRYRSIVIFIDHARDAAGAFVGAGTEYRILTSQKETGNDAWSPYTNVVCDITAASSIVMDGAEAAGQTRIETGATLPAVNDFVFFKHTTIALSEWSKVIKIDATGGSEYFDILHPLTNGAVSATIFNKAEKFPPITIDTRALKRIEIVVNNNNGSTNQAIVCRVACISTVA
jgi:hypothetical protein